ncbi:cobalt-precorrin-6A reductase [Paraburkholderia kururiensis]|uniref:Cobalt-precorrin-6A reductase n=1 Tax=Paraburkholderia kururiensis TaxID=984307 RepID=A0ABZ0WKS7_9BURK|nr:cobalt-precorrin-6A reductase [Paraburkholderia kururiensis]WQD77896.1 cobalt-precorrin-6A reductase [Paraburkholderia kururiensis]
MTRVLLLGGTGEALKIARSLKHDDVYSLAGLGKVPVDLACQVRVGGFGGGDGLARYLREQRVDLVIDATHPYAANMSGSAVAACRTVRVPCWALRRPAWQPGPGDDWRFVRGWPQLMAALAPFERPLFTTGREPLAHLERIPAHQYWTVRCLDAHPGNERCRVIGARGPFTLEGERALFDACSTDVVVSKNSGGGATEAKLDVARERGLPVILLQRPTLPNADRTFDEPVALLEALRAWRTAADRKPTTHRGANA